MPLAPDPELARSALAQLDALRSTVAAAEDEVLACLVVTGEPRPQRVLDDWLDQVADTLRALGESSADLSSALARFGASTPAAGAGADAGADADAGAGAGAGAGARAGAGAGAGAGPGAKGPAPGRVGSRSGGWQPGRESDVPPHDGDRG